MISNFDVIQYLEKHPSIDILDKAGMQTSIKENINEDTANKIVSDIMSAIEQDKKVYILD